MLAPRKIPPPYKEWNRLHLAPYGRVVPNALRPFLSKRQLTKARGPFALQPNNSTREFEYPWAFDMARPETGMRVLEIGGGLSGFQFVLERCGCDVVNVDPGLEAEGIGWPCNPDSLRELNSIFGTSVELRNCTIDQARLEDAAYDRVFSISVIEHMVPKEIPGVFFHVHRCLKQGGLFVLSLDLFLNLWPFSKREENDYGKNQNLSPFVGASEWKVVHGEPREMFGFPGFQPDQIQSHLENFLLGRGYPALVQCIVLQKI